MKKRKRKLNRKNCLILFAGISLFLILFIVFLFESNKPDITYLSDIPLNNYQKDKFYYQDNLLYYQDNNYTSTAGIDISAHNQEVDFKKLKANGFSFVFIRLGYRGYTEGGLFLDEKFNDYYREAKDSGLDIGIYFFSQAINENEALEEAKFVLKNLRNKELDLPIVYDYEEIDYSNSRMAHLGRKERSLNALSFLNYIKDSGHEVLLYTNQDWINNYYDLELLGQFPIWFAQYDKLPSFPYHYEYLQYSESGEIDGVKGKADLNICSIPNK